MLRALRLTAALLAVLAVPALAQAPSTTPPATKPTTATPAAPPPASSGFTTSHRPASTTAGTTPAATSAPAAPTAATPPPPPTTANPATRPGAPVAAAMAGKRIDINGASETDLAVLPGVGPATAKNIVQGRPWDDLADLVKKKAMTQPTFDRNKDHFALANINTSSAADMAKTLPGIGDKTAPKIVNARPYATPQDLVTKKVLTEAQFTKIKDLLTY